MYSHKFYCGRFWNYQTQTSCFFAVMYADRIPNCAQDIRRIVAVSVKEARCVYSLLTGE